MRRRKAGFRRADTPQHKTATAERICGRGGLPSGQTRGMSARRGRGPVGPAVRAACGTASVTARARHDTRTPRWDPGTARRQGVCPNRCWPPYTPTPPRNPRPARRAGAPVPPKQAQSLRARLASVGGRLRVPPARPGDLITPKRTGIRRRTVPSKSGLRHMLNTIGIQRYNVWSRAITRPCGRNPTSYGLYAFFKQLNFTKHSSGVRDEQWWDTTQ